MEDFVNIEGYKIHYVKKGDKGEHIILLHGLPMNSFLWRKVQDGLQDNFQTYAIDMLGYGKSDKPENADYTWNGQAKRIIGVMDALGIRKGVIVGHDHGGGVSLIIASKYTDRVSRFIFTNGCAYDYCLPPVVRLFGSLATLPDAQMEQIRHYAVHIFATFLWMSLYHKNRLTTDIMPNYTAPWETLEGFKALTKHCSVPSNQEILELDLSKITVPTLIVWALEDMGLPVESAYRLKKDISGPVRIETIATSGHFVPEEEPELLAKYMSDFLLSTIAT